MNYMINIRVINNLIKQYNQNENTLGTYIIIMPLIIGVVASINCIYVPTITLLSFPQCSLTNTYDPIINIAAQNPVIIKLIY